MPKARDPAIGSHDAALLHHGAITTEMMPDAVNVGDMFYWDGNQWQHIRITGGGGLDITYNAVEKTLEIYYGAGRVYGSATMDSVVLVTMSISLTADAVLV